MKWSEKSFAGGSLAAVMTEVMLAGKSRAKFAALAGKPGSRIAAPVTKCEAYFGWRPARELEEWCAVELAYLNVATSDVWLLDRRPMDLADAPLAKAINKSSFVMTAVTGLRKFGHDGSGDTCYVSTLPTKTQLAEVYVYDHETAELEGNRSGSIASFVAAHFMPLDEEDERDAHNFPWTKTQLAFDEAWEKSLEKRGASESPQLLFDRAKWLLNFPNGEPGFAFSESLGEAPTFATWKKESALLAKNPVLANYWMLAHYFFGNVDACREATLASKKCKGQITPQLAAIVAALLDKPATAKLGRLKPEQLVALREAVAKNAEPSQLDPKMARTVSAARAPAGKTSTPKEINARLAKGEDGWSLIDEFPDDVATHDLVLTKLAARDPALKKTVADYFEERASAAYSIWPYRGKNYDKRLTPAISAAFRSGLKYDADRRNAFPSLANTLAFADDDVAMSAFRTALEKLAGDDDRLKHVIEALRKSRHPNAPEVLEVGARRFFETRDAASALLAKKDGQGATLDNMFSVETHFVEALHILLRRRDARALALAKETLSKPTDLRVLGTCPRPRGSGDGAIRRSSMSRSCQWIFDAHSRVPGLGRVRGGSHRSQRGRVRDRHRQAHAGIGRADFERCLRTEARIS